MATKKKKKEQKEPLPSTWIEVSFTLFNRYLWIGIDSEHAYITVGNWNDGQA